MGPRAPSGEHSSPGDFADYEFIGYTSWGEVAGYFDGDGNVGLEIGKYTLRFRIRFIDTWRLQIEAIRSFLIAQELAVTHVSVEKSEHRSDAYRIEVGAVASLLRAAKEMLPHCVKKAEDLRIAIDYLENKITGDAALSRFNLEIRDHRRSGYIRAANLPLTKSEGVRAKQLDNARKARQAYAVDVPEDIANKIKDDRNSGIGYYTLAKRYGFSESVVRRILRSS